MESSVTERRGLRAVVERSGWWHGGRQEGGWCVHVRWCCAVGPRVERRDECLPSSGHFSLSTAQLEVVMLQKRNQELEVERVLCAELHGRTLLPPPPRAARVQACLWKVLLPRDAACTRRAALTSARGDRAPHGSAFGKLRRRPTAPHRGPAGLANAGQAASSASARSRWPRRTVTNRCVVRPLPLSVCFTVGGAVRGLWGA